MYSIIIDGRRLEREIQRMNVKMCKLTRDLKKCKEKRDLNNIEEVIKFAKRYIKEPTLSLFRSQLRVGEKGKRGRTWMVKEKSTAISLCHTSPKGYRVLGKLITLPSVSIIKEMTLRY